MVQVQKMSDDASRGLKKLLKKLTTQDLSYPCSICCHDYQNLFIVDLFRWYIGVFYNAGVSFNCHVTAKTGGTVGLKPIAHTRAIPKSVGGANVYISCDLSLPKHCGQQIQSCLSSLITHYGWLIVFISFLNYFLDRNGPRYWSPSGRIDTRGEELVQEAGM